MSNAASQVIGVDLGGTAIKLGRFDRQGQCLQSLAVPTPQPPDPETVVAAMVEAIAQLDPEGQGMAIGIGTPGPADATGRIARVAINLGWKDVPLADLLEARIGKPTILANDANCAGMGEYWRGAGKPFQDLILLTLGTGVGGAVILDGKLFVGRHGTAGELGLTTLDLAGHPCNSGNRGSLEQHASVQAIRRRTGLEPEELGKRAAAGDPEAIAFWKTYGCELGAGIASLIYVLTPQAVIIGGGVCAAAEFFMPSLLKEIHTRVLPSSCEDLQILVAELGNQAGMVGAAKLAWDRLDSMASLQAPIQQSVLPSASPSLQSLEADLSTSLSAQLLAQSQQFQAGFLARTAHELRSPLNSIISLHQLILSDLCDSPAEERDFVQQSNEAAQKMLNLLDHLLYVSKTHQGSLPLDIQPVCLLDLFATVQQLTYLQAQNRNHRLTVCLPPESLYALADPRSLQQALVGLVESAIQAIALSEAHNQPSTPEIRLSTTVHTDAEVWIELVDGRSPQSWESLSKELNTDTNAPADSSRTTHSGKPSPGFAVAIAQSLLQLMGGTLMVSPLSTDPSSYQIRCILPLVPLDSSADAVD